MRNPHFSGQKGGSSHKSRKQLGQAVESTHAENNLELGLDDFCITVDILKATELCLQMQGTSDL